MEEIKEIVKSTYESNFDVIKNIMRLYNIDSFDLDCTYSKGAFYKNLPEPKIKTDLYPTSINVIQSNSQSLPFEDETMSSIMYDPPFIIAGKSYKDNKDGSSIIAKRFEGYQNFEDLKKDYYFSLKELNRLLKKDGIVVFKCQDTVSGGKQHLTHVMIINMAISMGLYPKDLFILKAKNRLNSFGSRWSKQEHSRKYHSYFLVFQKTKTKINYEFSYLN